MREVADRAERHRQREEVTGDQRNIVALQTLGGGTLLAPDDAVEVDDDQGEVHVSTDEWIAAGATIDVEEVA